MPPRCRCHDYLRTRGGGSKTATREDEKALYTLARIDRTSGYTIYSLVARLKRRLYREWEIYVGGAFRGGRIKYAI